MARIVIVWLCIACFMPAWAGDTVSTVSIVNQARVDDCHVKRTLSSDRRLQRAAEKVARGQSPHDAAQAAGYPAVQLAMIHLAGYDDAALREVLARNYCKVLGQPQLQHVGVATRRDERWILVAAARSDPGDASTASNEVLRMVNEARSKPRRCGAKSFKPAPALRLNATLAAAAREHSTDMARHSYMDHSGRDGSTPAQRVTAQGYAWRVVGENVAAGAGDATEVMSGWLDSPGHCANIMSADFTEMGVAFAINPKDDYGVYWTQVFARPR